MKTRVRVLLYSLLVFSCFFIYIYRSRDSPFSAVTPEHYPPNSGIFMMETRDTLEPSSLALCAVESAARTYPNRPIFFYMGGLKPGGALQGSRLPDALRAVSSIPNVYLQPLDLEEVLKDTPLLPWYWKITPATERFWTHIGSDASRLALIWKYGGIYLDTDVISIRQIPEEEFLVCAYTLTHTSNGIFGFRRHQPFLWMCMEDFTENYSGEKWGYQGPQLVTRVLKRWGPLPKMEAGGGDAKCHNFSYLHPQRFYPIPPHNWEKYFEAWNPKETFDNSYGLHFFNFMNHKRTKMSVGSGSLAEHLYIKYCPNIYSREKTNVS